MNPEEPSKSADEQRDSRLRDIKSGDWKRFLYEDSIVTRSAFLKWFSEVFLQSPEGRSLPKDVQKQIYHITEPSVAASTTRESLSPAIIDVLKAWEAVPLVPGTRQWAIAHVRFIAFMLSHGIFRSCSEKGLVVTSSEVNEAQCWLHKQPDGGISVFKTIQQPWYHKDLTWKPKGGTFETYIEPSYAGDEREIEAAEADVDNPEALRISPQTLRKWMTMPRGSRESSSASSSQVSEVVKADVESPKAPRISRQNLQQQREAPVEEGESQTTTETHVVEGSQGLSQVDDDQLTGSRPEQVQLSKSQEEHTAGQVFQRDLGSDRSVATAAEFQSQATAVKKPEAEDGNSGLGGVFLEHQSATSIKVPIESHDREEQQNVKMDATPRARDSSHDERLHQNTIEHEGNSSDPSIPSEHTPTDSDSHGPHEPSEDGTATSANHLTSSPPGSPDWPNDHHQHAGSEATTEIEDTYEDALSRWDINDEADKENLPISNARDGTEGRLEVRLTDDPSYAVSRDQWNSSG
ncbi:MAG: hypothetical protein Q9182_004122 [Xanthomendoza sp. 2 TL-2023]